MASIPFALSVSHFVDTVGAKAGFAAIIGLAILVLLFFSQARETANLRRHAAESDQHVQQLELRVAQLTRAAGASPAVAPAPASVQRRPVAPPPAGVTAAAAAAPALVASRTAAPVAAVPTAPAGVGAPAMSSATRLIPTGDESSGSIAGTAAAAAAGAAVLGLAAAEASGDHGSGTAVASASGPAPATAAGGANGGQTNRAPAPAAAPAPPPPLARSGQQPPRPPQARTASTRPGGAPPGRSGGGSRGPSRVRPIAYAVAGVIAIAAVVVALLVLTSGSTNASSSSSSSQAAGINNGKHHPGRGAAAIKPSAVTVSVLNGTSTPNLAHDTGQRLTAAGYNVGGTGNATDQAQSATVVGYLPGHRAAALLVAKSLKLGPASVQPVAQANEAVACPQASACTTQVVVNVGADLASTATTSAAST